MTRQWRIEYENALYHVMSRGNEQRDIVRDDHDRERFLEILGNMSWRHAVDVHAYVLMNNHYHLLLSTPRANLSRSMQWFSVTYTQYFNSRHKRSGHLFQGRFKSFLVENDAYLMQLSCYIHRNPVRAGIVNRLIDYSWSSYQAYAYDRNKTEWLETSLILSQFPKRGKYTAYRDSVKEYAREDKRIWEDVKYGLLLGGQDFAEDLKNRFLQGKNPGTEFPQQKQILKAENAATKLKEAAGMLGLDIEELVGRRRVNQKDKEKRDLLLYAVWESGHYTNYEIGELFGLSYSAVSRRVHMLRKDISIDQKMRRKYKRVKSLIKM
jgi:REP element-mobilizing transposase RayT